MYRSLPFFPEAFTNRPSNREALIKPQKEKDETKAGKRKVKDIKIKFKKLHKHEDEKAPGIGTELQHKSKPYLNADSPPGSVGSDITEEHDLPSCSGSVCNFFDRVDSTNKRKRQDDPVLHTTRERLIIRIRLPLRKHSEPNSSAVEQSKNCPAKVPETLVQERTEEHASHAKIESKAVENGQLSLKQTLELPLAAAERAETESALYKTLIEDWVPQHPGVHLLQAESDDEEDWLFGSRSRQEPKRHKTGHEVPSSSTTRWPQAMHLPEVDIFALPYALPY